MYVAVYQTRTIPNTVFYRPLASLQCLYKKSSCLLHIVSAEYIHMYRLSEIAVEKLNPFCTWHYKYTHIRTHILGFVYIHIWIWSRGQFFCSLLLPLHFPFIFARQFKWNIHLLRVHKRTTTTKTQAMIIGSGKNTCCTRLFFTAYQRRADHWSLIIQAQRSSRYSHG